MSENAENTIYHQPTLFAEDSPVKICPLPESGRAWLESDQDFILSSSEFYLNLIPDGWTDGQSDSTRYRQLGNAVAVPVVEWIGRRIMEVENITTR